MNNNEKKPQVEDPKIVLENYAKEKKEVPKSTEHHETKVREKEEDMIEEDQ